MQQHTRLDMRVRTHHRPDIYVHDIVEIDGVQYSIVNIQSPTGYAPRLLDMDLEKIAQRYEKLQTRSST